MAIDSRCRVDVGEPPSSVGRAKDGRPMLERPWTDFEDGGLKLVRPLVDLFKLITAAVGGANDKLLRAAKLWRPERLSRAVLACITKLPLLRP